MRSTRNWSRFAIVLVACTAAASHLGSTAWAVPIVLDPTAGPALIFDQGGILNHGFYMGGLEVDPSGVVYVTQANAPPGQPSSTNRLVRSNGLGTAVQVGPNLNLGNSFTRGNDLTLGPGGLFYGAFNGGVRGLSPVGAPPTLFANSGSLASSGVSFYGGDVFVSTDSPGGFYRSPPGGGFAQVAAIGSVDDHVTTPGGTHYLIGDGSRRILSTGGATLYDLNTDPDTAPLMGLQGNGSRGARDPISGDIFMGYSFGGSNQSIFRVRSDFSDAIVFATNFGRNIRDFDFGPSSIGPTGSISLYVSVNDLATGIGTIYEIQTHLVPEPASIAVAALGFVALAVWRRRR